MGVSAKGKLTRGLGMVEFPHVPQIGSHILAAPKGSSDPNGPDAELHIYEVIDVTYEVGTPPEDGPSDGLRPLKGWEIIVEDRGPRRDFIYPNKLLPALPDDEA